MKKVKPVDNQPTFTGKPCKWGRKAFTTSTSSNPGPS